MIPQITIQEGYLLCLVLVPLLIQWLYYLGFFSVLFGITKKKKNTDTKAVSVIVCAKNEAKNLQTLLPALLNQKHPNFEVIIINDGSWDESNQLIEEFRKNHSNLKNIYIDPEKKLQSGKKLGITLGIKAAENEHLVFTDADCLPLSDEWLKGISQKFSEKRSIVLGYSPYQRKKGLLNWFIRFETQLTAMLYFSAAKRMKPYMSVGRNWAYTKSLFYEVKGFAKHHHIAAGDDDLLVQLFSKKSKAAISLNANTFCISEPKTSFNDWVNQKRRHLQIGKYYNGFSKFYSGLFVASHVLFFIALPILWILMPHLWMVFTGILALRYLVNWICFSLGAKKLKDLSTAIFYPIGDFLMLFYWLGMGIYIYFTKKQVW